MGQRLLMCAMVLVLAGAASEGCPPERQAIQLHDANGAFVGILTSVGISSSGVFDRHLGGFLYNIDRETAEVVTSRVFFEGPNCTGRAFSFIPGPRQVLVSNSGGTGEIRYWAGLAPNDADVVTLSRDNGDGTCRSLLETRFAGENLELDEVTDSVGDRFEELTGPLFVR